jgi:hypothetical protein
MSQFSVLAYRYLELCETFNNLDSSSRNLLYTYQFLCEILSLAVAVLIVKSSRELHLIQNATTFDSLRLLMCSPLPLHKITRCPLYEFCLDFLKQLHKFIQSTTQQQVSVYLHLT